MARRARRPSERKSTRGEGKSGRHPGPELGKLEKGQNKPERDRKETVRINSDSVKWKTKKYQKKKSTKQTAGSSCRSQMRPEARSWPGPIRAQLCPAVVHLPHSLQHRSNLTEHLVPFLESRSFHSEGRISSRLTGQSSEPSFQCFSGARTALHCCPV